MTPRCERCRVLATGEVGFAYKKVVLLKALGVRLLRVLARSHPELHKKRCSYESGFNLEVLRVRLPRVLAKSHSTLHTKMLLLGEALRVRLPCSLAKSHLNSFEYK